MNPVLSIDVSKEKSVAAAFLDINEPISKPYVFHHSKSHFQKLTDMLLDLENTYQTKPKVVMEATGNYSKPIAEFFYTADFEVYVLNPLTTHQIKKTSIRKIKTDPVDVYRIAHAFYTASTPIPFAPQDNIITSLKELSRQYEGFNNTATETQLRLISLLDSVFPSYGSLFSKIRNKASLALLYAYPTPELLLTATVEDLAEVMKPSLRSSSWRMIKAQKVLDAARENIGNHSAHQSSAISIRHSVELIIHLEDILTDIRTQMLKVAMLSPLYDLLRSIPGVGEVTAGVILAEIGDINRFPSKKQLVAYAGLEPSVFQSGKFTASTNRISKRGSPFLRRALYQATFIGISLRNEKPLNPVLHSFYTTKKAEGKHGKVALIATSNKLLCMIYGIMKSERPFEYR